MIHFALVKRMLFITCVLRKGNATFSQHHDFDFSNPKLSISIRIDVPQHGLKGFQHVHLHPVERKKSHLKFPRRC